MEATPPLDQWNLLISGGFQAPTGAEPTPLEREKKFKPPWKNSWIRPWLLIVYYGLLTKDKISETIFMIPSFVTILLFIHTHI